MAATVNLSLDTHTRLATHIQCTDTLGSVNLVRTNRQQIHFQLGQIDRQLARALSGIHVEQDAFFAGDFADGGDIGDGADLRSEERRVGKEWRSRWSRRYEERRERL